MKEYYIIKSLLPPYRKHRYLRSGNLYDYIGQILLQMDYDIPDGLRFPSELMQVIHPFTFPCRGSYHDTILTTRILQLDILDPTTHPQKMRELLDPVGISIKWLEKPTATQLYNRVSGECTTYLR